MRSASSLKHASSEVELGLDLQLHLAAIFPSFPSQPPNPPSLLLCFPFHFLASSVARKTRELNIVLSESRHSGFLDWKVAGWDGMGWEGVVLGSKVVSGETARR